MGNGKQNWFGLGENGMGIGDGWNTFWPLPRIFYENIWASSAGRGTYPCRQTKEGKNVENN